MRRAVLMVLLAASGAGATDVPLPGSLLLVKPGKLVRLVAHAPPGAAFTIPNPDDVTGPAGTLRVVDIGAAPGDDDDTYPLPGGWKALGKRTHVSGFRYHGTGTASDPCTLVLVKTTVVKAVCKGTAIRLTPPFAGDAAVLLSIGSTGDRYCATFGGTSVKNQTALLKRKSAPAAACPAGVTTTTTSSTTSTTTATTVTTTTLPPGPPLVINEIDYDQIGTDDHEFVEVYNPNPAPAALSGLALVFVNGTLNAEYLRIDLTAGGAIPAGECLVVGAPAITVPPTAVKLSPPPFDTGNNVIQNGPADGVVLLDATRNQILDALSYEGAITAATLIGVPGTVNLVEGTALPDTVADSNTVTGSLIRSPSGRDTNDAASDWVFTTTPTPGQPNVFTP